MSPCGLGGCCTRIAITALVFSRSSLFRVMSAIIAPDPRTFDFKWRPLVTFAALNPQRPELKDPVGPIALVSGAFLKNIQRINWMILTPSLVGDLTLHIQLCFDLARWRVTGELGTESLPADHPQFQQVTALANEFFQRSTQHLVSGIGTPEHEQNVLNAIDQGTQPVEMLATEGSPSRQGIEALLSSCIIGIWTAFETMAGDLWQTAVNLHPRTLAELKGARKRLLKGVDDDAPSSDDRDDPDRRNKRSVPLNDILRYEYDIRDKMGTVLRNSLRFDYLTGIREAYALAFSKKFDAIDAILKHESFDALSSIRNLIVHRSSIVDSTYEQRTKYLKIPIAPLGSQICLDGETVRDLMQSVIVCSLHLIVAVDDWVASN